MSLVAYAYAENIEIKLREPVATCLKLSTWEHSVNQARSRYSTGHDDRCRGANVSTLWSGNQQRHPVNQYTLCFSRKYVTEVRTWDYELHSQTWLKLYEIMVNQYKLVYSLGQAQWTVMNWYIFITWIICMSWHVL